MKWGEGRSGRVFILKLEDGDVIPEAVEEFCREKSLQRGMCFFTGGVKSGKIVAGPCDGEAREIEPIIKDIEGVFEMSGTGTIFPDEDNSPRLHMHASFGRGGAVITGCVRKGVEVWKLGEAVIFEIDNSVAARKFDPVLKAAVMEP